ncbi:MAG: twin-arginine translocation signal domain-containing protein [Anaerolineales bacterium]|nr:twin-arginine translocation signal domain-containing protein [Anaerolineales bacterium]
MSVKNNGLKSINRRQFIRLGATTTAGLFLAACGANLPPQEPTPTEVASVRPIPPSRPRRPLRPPTRLRPRSNPYRQYDPGGDRLP